MFDPVQVEVGFHTPRLADGVDMVDRWAETVGLDVELAREMAEAILVRHGGLGRARSTRCTRRARAGSSIWAPATS